MTDGNLLGLVLNGLIGVWMLHIKTKHDEELRSLKAQNAEQERQIARNTDELRQCRDEHAATKATLEETRVALAAKTAAEHKALQDQIDVLRRMTDPGEFHDRLRAAGLTPNPDARTPPAE